MVCRPRLHLSSRRSIRAPLRSACPKRVRRRHASILRPEHLCYLPTYHKRKARRLGLALGSVSNIPLVAEFNLRSCDRIATREYPVQFNILGFNDRNRHSFCVPTRS